jgi:hypothetical protein
VSFKPFKVRFHNLFPFSRSVLITECDNIVVSFDWNTKLLGGRYALYQHPLYMSYDDAC